MNACESTAPMRSWLLHVSALLAGVLFALGLGVSGMTQPAKIVGFLDFFGDWDPALLGVMAGGIAVYALLFRVITRRSAPIFSETFALPTRRDVDARLLAGSALFGVGWALSGLCPGPALTSLATGGTSIVIFVGFMVAGMLLERHITTRVFR